MNWPPVGARASRAERGKTDETRSGSRQPDVGDPGEPGDGEAQDALAIWGTRATPVRAEPRAPAPGDAGSGVASPLTATERQRERSPARPVICARRPSSRQCALEVRGRARWCRHGDGGAALPASAPPGRGRSPADRRPCDRDRRYASARSTGHATETPAAPHILRGSAHRAGVEDRRQDPHRRSAPDMGRAVVGAERGEEHLGTRDLDLRPVRRAVADLVPAAVPLMDLDTPRFARCALRPRRSTPLGHVPGDVPTGRGQSPPPWNVPRCGSGPSRRRPARARPMAMSAILARAGGRRLDPPPATASSDRARPGSKPGPARRGGERHRRGIAATGMVLEVRGNQIAPDAMRGASGKRDGIRLVPGARRIPGDLPPRSPDPDRGRPCPRLALHRMAGLRAARPEPGGRRGGEGRQRDHAGRRVVRRDDIRAGGRHPDPAAALLRNSV